MSYVESPAETFKRFTQTKGWKTASVEILTADFLSMSNESNLRWNPYYYEERGGRLFDPVREQNVAGTANGDEVEENVISQLENWFINHESGLGVWISPRGDGIRRRYLEEQITFYRIAYKPSGQKILLCASHQFKASFRNPEDLRRFIFTEDDNEESIFEIINWLKRISQKKVEVGSDNLEERREQAKYYAHQFRSGVPKDEIKYHMTQTGFLGENPIGCGASNQTTPLSYSENFTPSFNYEVAGWHNGICRICETFTWVGPCQICRNCEKKF